MPLIILFKPFTGLNGPTAAPLSLQGGTLSFAFPGVPYSRDISGLANGGRPPYTFSRVSQSGPNNYAVSGVGVISGTPTALMSDTVVVQVQDALGATAQATYLIPLDFVVITTSSLPGATVGAAYSYQVQTAGGFGALTYAMSASPNTGNWLTINSVTGVLSGTPQTAEADSVTIQVTDSLGQPSAPSNFTLIASPKTAFNAVGWMQPIWDSAWRVDPPFKQLPMRVPQVASSQVATPTFSPPAGTYASTQSVTISCATAGSVIYYTLDGSTPVVGVSPIYKGSIPINATETLQAIGSATGLTVSNVGSAAYTINMAGALAFTSPAALPNATNGGFFAYQLQADGGKPPYSFTLGSATGATTPAVIKPNGYIHAAPTATGANTWPVTVTDANNATAAVNFTCTVDTALRIYPISADLTVQALPNAMAGNKYRHTMLANGGTNAGFTWSATGLTGTGLSLSATGVISGTPTTSGVISTTITVQDNGANSFSFAFTIAVAANANVTRPAYNTGSGFFVLNGQLYDPNGAPFRIRGFNQDHWDSGSTTPMAHAYPSTVRFVLYHLATDVAQESVANSSHLANQHLCFVQRFGNITTPPAQQGNSSGSTDPTLVSAMVTDWINAFSVWSPIQNSIILGIANEWGPSGSSVWRDTMITAIGRLRTAGYTCPIACDSGGFGQNTADFLTYSSAVFNSDPQKNVIFDYHLYGVLTPSTYYSALSQFAAISASNGQVFVVGEFGPFGNVNNQTVWPAQIITACEQLGIGWLAWAWDDPGFEICNNGNTNGPYPPISNLSSTQGNQVGYGRDVILNPQYGVTANATPASSFL